MTDAFTIHTAAVVAGVLLGALTRWMILRTDYRNYPGYPHGYLSHMALGTIAAALGALAPVALASGQYTAVTFLTLAAQQFLDIRNMERQTLAALEEHKLVRRGKDYIEGIARVFEARNYQAIAVALAVSGVTVWTGQWLLGLGAGLALLWLAVRALSGEPVSSIARVEAAPVEFRGADLYVGGVQIMNVGLPEARQFILDHGVGAVLEPRDGLAAMTLSDPGQRQAILHDAAIAVGLLRDVDTPEFTPLMRRHLGSTRLALFVVAEDPDPQRLVEAVGRVPVLESSRRRAARG